MTELRDAMKHDANQQVLRVSGPACRAPKRGEELGRVAL
jgi:hypothetical protein